MHGIWWCHLACIWSELTNFDKNFCNPVWASASQIVFLRKLMNYWNKINCLSSMCQHLKHKIIKVAQYFKRKYLTIKMLVGIIFCPILKVKVIHKEDHWHLSCNRSFSTRKTFTWPWLRKHTNTDAESECCFVSCKYFCLNWETPLPDHITQRECVAIWNFGTDCSP